MRHITLALIYLSLLLMVTPCFADELDEKTASWGSVDFRILESDNPSIFPIVIDIENTIGEELEATLIIETLTPDASYGQSDYEEDITIPINPELIYVDFEVSEGEEKYDVWVWVYVDDEPAYKLYNSITRIEEKDIKEKDQLPLLPGEKLREEIGEYLEEFEEKYDEDVTPQEVIAQELKEQRQRTTKGIIITIAGLLLVAFIGWYALRSDSKY
jgi:hypothetical protein